MRARPQSLGAGNQTGKASNYVRHTTSVGAASIQELAVRRLNAGDVYNHAAGSLYLCAGSKYHIAGEARAGRT
jgi:hypothetical protein